MNPLLWVSGASLTMLLVAGLALKSQITENGKLQARLTADMESSAALVASANSVAAEWKAQYELVESEAVSLQRALAKTAEAERVSREAARVAQRTLQSHATRVRANDPSNCLVAPVHSGVDERMRSAGARVSVPAPARREVPEDAEGPAP